MAIYKIAEKFVSINGEARRAGEPAVFLRLAGCNLRCSYCDTAWAIGPDAPYEPMELRDIVSYAASTGINNVTITGGEPLIAEGITDLVAELIAIGKTVEIETNGAVSIAPMYELARELHLTDQLSLTVDYKCPGSGMEDRMLLENFELLRSCDSVKFVISDRKDLERALEIVERYALADKCMVYFGAVFGSIDYREIVEFMIEHKLNGVRFQLQQHKFIWNPDARGV